jgi:hypothetical protein
LTDFDLKVILIFLRPFQNYGIRVAKLCSLRKKSLLRFVFMTAFNRVAFTEFQICRSFIAERSRYEIICRWTGLLSTRPYIRECLSYKDIVLPSASCRAVFKGGLRVQPSSPEMLNGKIFTAE